MEALLTTVRRSPACCAQESLSSSEGRAWGRRSVRPTPLTCSEKTRLRCLLSVGLLVSWYLAMQPQAPTAERTGKQLHALISQVCRSPCVRPGSRLAVVSMAEKAPCLPFRVPLRWSVLSGPVFLCGSQMGPLKTARCERALQKAGRSRWIGLGLLPRPRTSGRAAAKGRPLATAYGAAPGAGAVLGPRREELAPVVDSRAQGANSPRRAWLRGDHCRPDDACLHGRRVGRGRRARLPARVPQAGQGANERRCISWSRTAKASDSPLPRALPWPDLLVVAGCSTLLIDYDQPSRMTPNRPS